MQAKLLRVLENGEYQRVGETQRRVARCRVVAATNRDLRARGARGRVPRRPLPSPVGLHAERAAAARAGARTSCCCWITSARFRAKQAFAFELDDGAVARWLRYDFPGNVRELRNIVIRLAAKYPGQRLSAAELEPELDVEDEAFREAKRTTHRRAGPAPARARRAVRPRPDAEGLGARLYRGGAAPDARQRQPGREAARREPHDSL